MQQKEIIINEVSIPVIEEGGVVWYPVSYMGREVLLKSLSPSQLRDNGYREYIKMFKVDFGEYMIQDTYCINEDGLKIILRNSKIGRLSVEQKRAMNKVFTHLNMELIMEDERFIKTISKEKILQYPEYIQDCIQDVLNDQPDTIWQRCGKCNNYYPYHVNFFRENPHCGNNFPLYTKCRNCQWTENRSKDWIRRNNNELSTIYRKCNIETYKLYKNQDLIGIYEDWMDKQYSKYIPSILNNKEGYLKIIEYLFDVGELTVDNLILDTVIKKYKLGSLQTHTGMNEIYTYLFGNDHLNFPWKYPNFQLNGIESKQYKKILNNYIQNNNIKIDNIYDYDYMEVLKKCRIYSHISNDILGFVMEYYNNEYPAYKFTIKSVNYWLNRENRIRALKYLIEEDMKLLIEKVPLYLTLENLRRHSNTMRSLLRKYYDNNVWNWVNEVYPGRFDEGDFNITVIRNVFDSAEEHIVHDILIGKFKNVIYNQRNTKNTITIKGMHPDWIIITDNGIWVVEYFGISVDQREYNKRVTDYKEKTLSKISKYKCLKWLGTVYVYPDDLKDNFKGLEDKLKVVV